MGLAIGAVAHAATSRPAWVTSQLYSFNHQFAATNSTELAAKMSTMAGSPFQFYRGTAHIFFQDMLTRPGSAYATTQSGFTWLSGDMHIGNFAADRDSKNDNRFAVNDFDEGYLGQYVWDLRRLAASLVLAGRENAIADADISTAINTLVGSYVDKLGEFKGSSAELTYKLKSSNTSGAVQDVITKASNNSRSDLLAEYTQVSGGVRSFKNLPDLVAANSSTTTAISAAMSSYIASIPASKRKSASYYGVKDIHQKLYSGVGSLGKLRYYVLIQGPTSDTTDDRILEVKQTIVSAVATASGGRLPASAYGYNEGCRAAKTLRGQLLDADELSGCAYVNSTAYFFREKSPYKENFDYTVLTTAGKLNTASDYLGKALAVAHALADQDYDATIVSYSIDKQISDAVTSKSGLKAEIVTFAFDYAAQAQLDWQAFVAAYNAGTPMY